MAAVCGLTLLNDEELNPLNHYLWLGELILDALDKGCKR